LKLQFKEQAYQIEATNSVVDVFAGQGNGIRKERYGSSEELIQDIFSNQKIHLVGEELMSNLRAIQKSQGLALSSSVNPDDINLTVEMETGTGKTYVYTRTMYELNKRYGWSKFIIMVPSIAIREGVKKSLEITEEHFQEIYGKKIRFFVYDSRNKSNLINIKNFSRSNSLEVIIMNYQAFATTSKDSRKIYQRLDSLQSDKPIDILKGTRPILIIDEPQRFGDKAEEIFQNRDFNQLLTIRYSATHKKDYTKVHRLDAIDAFNNKLVKKIAVKGIEVVGNSGTNSYLFLDRIQTSVNEYPVAFLEIELKQKNGLAKKIVKVKEKDDLFVLSNELRQYKGFVVKVINAKTNLVEFTNGVSLRSGQTVGDVNEEHLRRIQIRETIRSHIEKERELFNRGIKVLSLFFIDEVAKYRQYDTTGKSIPGIYAQVFEEEYNVAISDLGLFDPDYQHYLAKFSAREVQSGYFSIDKKGQFVDSKEKKGEGSDDASAYDLIMKNKERLLSFAEPTRFIFSHSALREGWDNPNVFQICTLKHSQSNISKRQEIGRGLRICVNSRGERMDQSVLEGEFFDTNKLTVIASESYENFAKDLQREIAETLSDRPTRLNVDVLKHRILKNEKGDLITLSDTDSMDLIIDWKSKAYLDEDYKITEKLIADIDSKKLVLPSKFVDFGKPIAELIKSIHQNDQFLMVENDKDKNVEELELKPNENFFKKEFQDLWKKIKVQTVYEVDFDSQELIQKSIRSIEKNLQIKKISVHISTGEQKEVLDEKDLKKGQSMSEVRKLTESTSSLLGSVQFDILGEITKNTHLTRTTIASILKGLSPTCFSNYRVNPEDFIAKVSDLINSEKATTLINNIRYSKIHQSYDDSIFTINHFKGSLATNVLEVTKHVHHYLKTDSTLERNFARSMEAGQVLVYAKLPSGFKIPTPLGNYNPDWAIVFDTAQFKYIYFIAETKGSMDSLQLRAIEDLKIQYARKHFEALGHSDIKYDVVDSYDSLMNQIMR
jgi:type III restriction enzyme